MVKLDLVQTQDDLVGILALQDQNHFSNLSHIEKQSQGFVTVKHDLLLLSRMNAKAKSVIAKSNGSIIAYNLVMTKSFRNAIPILIPMFDQMDALKINGQTLRALDYVVCGQICIAKAYRSKGIFEKLYKHFQFHYKERHPYILTEIAFENIRSLKAHLKVGFRKIKTYQDTNGQDWVIVIWEWR